MGAGTLLVVREGERDRTETVLLLVVWVVPLLAAVGLLVAADLLLLAGALLAVEVTVGLLVLLIARRPKKPSVRRPAWLVPAGMVGVLLVLLGITLAAAQFG